MILCFFSFPFPTVSVYDQGRCVFLDVKRCPQSDVYLPLLVESALQSYQPCVYTTFSGEGPFSAMRTAHAFLRGLSCGQPDARAIMCSFLDILKRTASPSEVWVLQEKKQWQLGDEGWGPFDPDIADNHALIRHLCPSRTTDEDMRFLCDGLYRYAASGRYPVI